MRHPASCPEETLYTIRDRTKKTYAIRFVFKALGAVILSFIIVCTFTARRRFRVDLKDVLMVCDGNVLNSKTEHFRKSTWW